MEKKLTFEERMDRFAEETEKSSARFREDLAASRVEFDRKLTESRAEFDRMLAASRAEDAKRADEREAAAAKRAAEFDRMVAESRAEDVKRKAEFDRMLAESRAESRAESQAEDAKRKAEFDRNLAESRAEDAKRAAEREAAAAKRATEFDRNSAEINKRDKKICKEIFGIGHQKYGHHAEQYFQNALRNNLVFGEEKYDKMIPNLKSQGKKSCEFDMVLVNGKSVALIEAKHRVHPDFIGEMVTKKAVEFRTYFPEYEKYDLYLGVAGFSFDESVAEEAQKYGVGILRQDGDAVVESGTENLKAY